MIARPIKTISVIGAGSWGTALARLLALKEFNTRLWAYEQEVAESIQTNHVNSVYLPNIPLPDSLSATSSLEKALDSTDLLVLAVPSHAMGRILEVMSPYLSDPIPVTIA
ncbi:MAG: NAD(P)-binding domain-containing protein, partial [Nitrospirales bacterium]